MEQKRTIKLPRMFRRPKERPVPKRAEKWALLYRDTGEDEYFQRFLSDFEPVLDRIVIGAAYNYNMGEHAEDLKSICAATCMNALFLYEPEKCSLRKFVQSYVWADMLDYIRTMRSGYIVSTRSTDYVMRKIMWEYHQHHDRTDDETLQEIADKVNRKPKTVMRYIMAGVANEMQVAYYYRNRDDDSERTLEETISDSSADPQHALAFCERTMGVTDAFQELQNVDRDIVSLHLQFCERCATKQDRRQTFQELALRNGLRSPKAAENHYRKALDQMALQLFEGGRCHLVRLRRIKQTARTVTYAYLADEDGEWGEIRYDRRLDTFEVARLADWDLMISQPFAEQAKKAIRKMAHAQKLANEALVPWRE